MAMNFARLLTEPKERRAPSIDELLCDDPLAHELEQEAVADVKKIVKELREELEKPLDEDA